MEYVIDLIAGLIEIIYSSVPVMGLAIILYALMMKILSYGMVQNYYLTVHSKMLFSDAVEDIKKRYKGDEYTKQLTKFLVNNKYPMIGGLVNDFINCVFSFCIVPAFNNVDKYFKTVSGEVYFIGLPLSKSPMDYINEEEIGMNFIGSVLLLLLALGLMIVHDSIMDRCSLVDQSYYKILWFIFALAFLFHNSAFTLYWIAIKIFDLCHIYIVKKFKAINPNLNKK